MLQGFICETHYLNLGVTEYGPKCEIVLLVDGCEVNHFRVRLALDAPDYFVATEIKKYIGKRMTIEVRGYQGIDPYAKMSLDNRRTGHERIYHEDLRPRFHYSAICGWLNDPNGLLYYRGKWFLFAQLNPYSRLSDNMHWHMATSTDLLHWEDKGLVLCPDASYVKFSGSGIVDEKNVTGLKDGDDDPILLFYTDAGPDFRQSMAYSTDGGKTFREYEHNPILPHLVDYNRDPKVISRPDGNGYWMALYLSGNDYGLFESEDLLHWEKTCVLHLPGCCECPDIYEIALDGDDENKKMVFSCAGGQYLIGKIENGEFLSETEIQYCYCVPGFQTVYAPQTFYGAPESRRVQIICSSNQTMLPGEAFCKFLTIPCELSLRTVLGGMKLFNKPVRELRNLECNLITEHETIVLVGIRELIIPQSGLFRVEFAIPTDFEDELLLQVYDLTIPYHGKDHSVEYNGVRFLANPREERIAFDLVVDRCSAELFVNDGEIYLPVIQPFDWSLTPLILKSEQSVKISDLRIVELQNLLPWSQV